DQLRELPSPRTFNQSIPESLDAVIMRVTRRNPDERYPSARDMQQALLAVEADILDRQETVMIEPSPRPAGEGGSSALVGRSQVSLARPAAPRRWLPVAAAVLALSTALVVAVLLLLGRGGGDGRAASPAAADAGTAVLAPPPDAVEARYVHLVVLGAPPDAIVKIGDVGLSGDPPEGDVPWSDGEVEVVVAAQGFETFRTKVTPDQHKTVRAEMQPIATTVVDLRDGPDAGPAEADAAPADAGAPARRDVARPPRDYGRRTDTAAPPPADAAAVRDTAAARDIVRVTVDGAGRLPDDPFASARRLPQEATF
ncbi:MAG: hypothetical protein JXB32_25725, partial [Deltaproteobacteria bacterium]|nr:hypothetical protein [Deltaproteobacteria bacterium]